MNDVELVVNSSDNMDLVASSSDDESTLRAVLAFVEGSDCSGSSMDASPSVAVERVSSSAEGSDGQVHDAAAAPKAGGGGRAPRRSRKS